MGISIESVWSKAQRLSATKFYVSQEAVLQSPIYSIAAKDCDKSHSRLYRMDILLCQ